MKSNHSTHKRSLCQRWLPILSFAMVLSMAFSLLGRPELAQAGVVAGYSEYFLPGGTDQIMAILDDIEASSIGTQLTNVTTVSVGGDNVTLYYDHWENGYGSGNTGADETYPANKGSVLTFKSTTIPYPRGSSMTVCTGSTFPGGGSGGAADHCYDGRDRIYVAGGAVSVAQAFWPTTSNTNFANAWEVYPIKPYQTTYIIPVGENLYAAGGSFADFLKVFVIVQTTFDNTSVQIDDPETAGVEVNETLNRGEVTQLFHIWSGTTVTANQPVQVQFIVGEDVVIPSQNNSRSYTAVPNSLWSASYYSPVPGNTGGYDTDLFIYNPTGSALTVNFQDGSGSGSFDVAANATESYQANVGRYVPTNSAVYLGAADGATKFWAVGSADAGSPTFNWGFTLIPPQTLTDEYYVSWAPGGWNQGGGGTPQDSDFSPVYVTPIQNNTTIFVDNSPTDGVVDQTYTLNRIQMQRIFDTTDADNTGMHIWATAPIAIVWGEDPSTSDQASPGLDAGYTILPLNQEWIDIVLMVDKSANPTTLPTGSGQTSTFTLVVESDSFSVDDVAVVDTLPSNWAYVPDSTTITLPDGTSVATNPTINGQDLTWDNFPPGGLLDMLPNQSLMIVFQGITTGTSAVGFSTNLVTTNGTRNGQTFTATDKTTLYFSDLLVTKNGSPSGAVNAGDTILYTINVTNNGSSRQTNINVSDPLPVGTSYVAGSAQLTLPTMVGSVGDSFNSQAYTGNQDSNGNTTDPSWTPSPGTWNELGETTNATAGDMRVMNDTANTGQYELRIMGDGSNQNGVYREVDLSSCTSAYLSMSYRRVTLENSSDYVRLSIGINGNPSTTLYDFAGRATGTTTDLAYQTYSADISSFLDNNTRIQLRGPATFSANDIVWFDDVLIECFSATPTTLPAGVPPDLVPAASAYFLNAGQSLWVVYQVSVDNPLPSGLVNVVNTVGVTSSQQPAPTWRTVINPVNTGNRAVIGNAVWLDENGDGVQDAGESGIPNVTVNLYDSTGTILIASTVTDANGNYVFKNVPPNTYQVNVDNATLPAGMVQSTPTGSGDGMNKPDPYSLTVAAGEENTTVDFGFNWAPSGDVTGNSGTGAIGDRVWIDADGDGFQDANEAGLAGVVVELFTAGPDGLSGTADDAVSATTTTDVAGNYIFDEVAAGVYAVRIPITPSGYSQTGDPDHLGTTGTNDNQTTTPIILSPGDVFVDADFGYQPDAGTSGSIGDRVWLDLDADGAQDGLESGIPDVTVALIRDLDGDGNWGLGEPIVAADITDANGNYLVPGLSTLDGTGSDDYLVWVNDTNSVLDSLVSTYDSNGVATPNLSAANNLSPSGDVGQDFGYSPAGQSTGHGLIGDTVFLDSNGDYTYDDGEGMESIRVCLYNTDGIVLMETYTNENGLYTFSRLPAGTYVVKVDATTLPAGLANTVDPDSGISHQSTVVLQVNQIDLDQDFGYTPNHTPNAISGTLWRDTDANGTLDGSEASRFAGITVVLYDSYGNIVDTTTSDANGDYAFTNLPNGTYTVDVTDEDNVLNGYWHSQGSTPSADSNSQIDPYTVTVSGGQTNITADFGYYLNPDIVGNYVWLDLNNDGVQDGTEPGLQGIAVSLTITYPNGLVNTVTTLSGPGGVYSFGNLLLDENFDGAGAGEPVFTIRAGTPPGMAPSPEALPADNDQTDGDSDGESEIVTVLEGEVDNTYDFGFFGYLDLGDLPSNYPTLFSPGPANVVFPDGPDADTTPDTTYGRPAVWLGVLVDTEPDGQPNPDATGDGLDEDGMALAPLGWIAGSSSTLTITLNSSESGVTVYFGLWIDWGIGGPPDGVIDSYYSGSGITGGPVEVPVGVSVPINYSTPNHVYFRVRVSDRPLTPADYRGSLVNGEVEDYLQKFGPTAIELTTLKAAVRSEGKVLPWIAGIAFILSSLGMVVISHRRKFRA